MSDSQKTARTKSPSHPTGNDRPLWSIRLRLALEQTVYVDKNGKVNKKALGKKFGVGPKAVEYWIDGKREPKFSVMVELSEITECSLDWLFGKSGSKPFVKKDNT